MCMLETVGPVKNSQCFYPLNPVSSPHFEFSSEETNIEWVWLPHFEPQPPDWQDFKVSLYNNSMAVSRKDQIIMKKNTNSRVYLSLWSNKIIEADVKQWNHPLTNDSSRPSGRGWPLNLPQLDKTGLQSEIGECRSVRWKICCLWLPSTMLLDKDGHCSSETQHHS